MKRRRASSSAPTRPAKRSAKKAREVEQIESFENTDDVAIDTPVADTVADTLPTNPPATSGPAPAPPSSDEFTICFWNVNGLRSVLRPKEGYTKSPLQDFVKLRQPSILCLSEIKIDCKQIFEFERILLGYRGYFACSSDKKGYAGVAAFIKEGVKVKFSEDGLKDEELDNEGRVQTIKVLNVGANPFYIVNTYVMNAGRGLTRLDFKLQRFNPALYAYLNRLKEECPVIWGGDLNVAHKEIDIWNPKGNLKSAGFTIEERDSFGRFLEDSGWVDVFRYLYPEKVQYTYWSPMRATNFISDRGWRLDYFVVPKDFLSRCKDVETLKFTRGSDHCPIILHLDITIPSSKSNLDKTDSVKTEEKEKKEEVTTSTSVTTQTLTEEGGGWTTRASCTASTTEGIVTDEALILIQRPL